VAEPVVRGEEAPGQQQEPRPETEETRTPWWLALKLTAVAAAAGVLGLLAWATPSAGSGSSLVARIAAGKRPAAPAFDLSVIWPQARTWPKGLKATLADGRLALRALRGYPVAVNFWASWCIPCRQEAPILHAAALRNRGRVVFLGVDVQDLTGDARGFARKYEMNYVSVRESGNAEYNAYGLTGVPETYFLDARGRIVSHIPGAVSSQTLEEGIATITKPSRGGTLRGGAHLTR